MSEHFTIVKSRKKIQLTVNEGDYFILVQPSKSFDQHLANYRKMAETGISEDFSQLSISALRHTNPLVKLVTKAEKDEANEAEVARNGSIDAIVGSAKKRQDKMEEKRLADLQKDHEKRLAIKNADIEHIRKNTGQKPAVAQEEKPAAVEEEQAVKAPKKK